jgi:hypothetical protein
MVMKGLDMAWKWIHKSRILDGVLMVLLQKQNRTCPCLKSYGPYHKCFGAKRTHSCVPGLKAEALFFEHQFFLVFLPITD